MKMATTSVRLPDDLLRLAKSAGYNISLELRERLRERLAGDGFDVNNGLEKLALEQENKRLELLMLDNNRRLESLAEAEVKGEEKRVEKESVLPDLLDAEAVKLKKVYDDFQRGLIENSWNSILGERYKNFRDYLSYSEYEDWSKKVVE